MVTRTERSVAEKTSRLLDVVRNPTRLLIVLLLRDRRGAYVQEIADELEMSQSAVSHQLHILEQGGVASFTKEGRDVLYQLSRKQPARKLLKILRSLSI
ncbi:MAG TPA: metalloregulator ArsR/SmtB family transcription factor [Candidatus Paceibacterota bacterium]